MLSESFKNHINTLLPEPITQVIVLTGGDINDVYKLQTPEGNYVIKLNDANAFPNMFELEKLGLEHIAATKTFTVPTPLHTGTYQDKSFLILEYIKSAPKQRDFAAVFGQKLARMHQHTANFGFEQDNYIGSLQQLNAKESNALDFFRYQRLEPQFKMAQ